MLPPMSPVRRILASTDRSPTADRAVAWAADMAARYEAELLLLQVLVPDAGASSEKGSADAEAGLHGLARTLGVEARPRVVNDSDPAEAICRVAEEDKVDVVVVGNVGMSGRKEFLLGNVPNRVSHKARCTVVIVNTTEEPRRRRLGRKR
jgi:nucleotide-binding universal stress UspA family protein